MNREELEDLIGDAISDSLDMDWNSRDGAKAVIAMLEREGLRVIGSDSDLATAMIDERELIRELANDLAANIYAIMQEGGVASSSIGEPLDTEDSPLGRACAYLNKPIPVCAGWNKLAEL